MDAERCRKWAYKRGVTGSLVESYVILCRSIEYWNTTLPVKSQ